MDDDAHNIVNPVFNNVTIDATDRSYDNGASGDSRVRFFGTYQSLDFSSVDNSILLVGGSNMLYNPSAGATIGACRAYFKLGDEGTAGVLARITAFTIDFGEGNDATGVTTPLSSRRGVGGEAWYSLDGRKLDGQPTTKGVYILNGKKIVIK